MAAPAVIRNVSTAPVSEECFGLRPTTASVTCPYLLQWADPTFDEAEPALEAWLTELNTEPEGGVIPPAAC